MGEPETAGGGDADRMDGLGDSAMSVAEEVGPSTVACIEDRPRGRFGKVGDCQKAVVQAGMDKECFVVLFLFGKG